jgi:hypothetical protein
MTCRRAFDLDLVACLLDAARPEWSEFREHYPRCPECAAEVRTWTELQSTLAPPHPAPEDLIRFEARANDMDPEARKAVAAHIATCRSCRDELRALHAFDPRTVAAAGAPAAAAKRRWWSPVRLVLHPAFAYGVALALAFPLLAPQLRPLVERARQVVPSSWPAQVPAPAARVASRKESADRTDALGTVAGGAAEPALDALADTPRDAVPAAAPPAEPNALAKAAPAALEAGANTGAATDETPVVVLAPEREVAIHVPAHGLVLRLAPPRSQPALPAGLAWLRVRDAAGRRELREQQFGSPGSNAEIRIPAGWLEPGAYRADLVLGDDNRPISVARFRVEP